MKASKPIIGAFVATAVIFGANPARADQADDFAQLCAVFQKVQPEMSALAGMEGKVRDSKTTGAKRQDALHKLSQRMLNDLLIFNAAATDYLKANDRPIERQRLLDPKYAEAQDFATLVKLLRHSEACPVYVSLEVPKQEERPASPLRAGTRLALLQK